MISLAAVAARSGGGFRKAASVLVDASFTWERGVLAVVGAPADGTTALLDVIAGRTRVRRGRVVVKDGASVVHVAAAPALPDGLRVEEVCALSAELRGELSSAPASERLAALGVTHLAERRVQALSKGEARAVQLALALTSRADVLLLEEPLAWLEGPAAARVADVLRARAASTCVVVTTASVRDAVRLADSVLVATQGVLAPAPPGYAHVGSEGARLTIVLAPPGDAPDPRIASFVAALGRERAVAELETAAYAGKGAGPAVAVVASGTDLVELARAVARVAGELGAPVEVVEPAVVSLDALRAAVSATRAACARGGAPTRAWLAPAAWALLALVVASAMRARGAVHGADDVVQGTFGALVLPLLAFAVVGASVGKGGLGASTRGLVAIGASPGRAALATTLVAVATTAVLGALLTVLVVVVAHGPADPSLVRDVPASFLVGALGGAAYAAYFCAGAAATKNGALRGGLLVVDFLFGGGPGTLAFFTPRAHLVALLGARPVLDLPRAGSFVALVVLTCVYAALAVRLSRRPP